MKLAEKMKLLCENPIKQKELSPIQLCKKIIKNAASKGYFYTTFDGESLYDGTDLRKYLEKQGFEITFENEFVAYIIWKR